MLDFYDQNAGRQYPLVEGEHTVGGFALPDSFILDAGLTVEDRVPTDVRLLQLIVVSGVATLSVDAAGSTFSLPVAAGVSRADAGRLFFVFGDIGIVSTLGDGEHAFSTGAKLERSRIASVVPPVTSIRLYSEVDPASSTGCLAAGDYFTYVKTGPQNLRQLAFSRGHNAEILETVSDVTVSYSHGAGTGQVCCRPPLISYESGSAVEVAQTGVKCDDTFRSINKVFAETNGDFSIISGKQTVITPDADDHKVTVQV